MFNYMKKKLLTMALRWYLKETIRQGNEYHRSGFKELFSEIFTHMQEEFYEDNDYSLRSYMKKCMKRATIKKKEPPFYVFAYPESVIENGPSIAKDC